MPTIKDYFEQAQLAQAAYANLDGSLSLVQALQETGTGKPNFSTSQANEFDDHYRVIHHLPNTSSGFSATLFQNIDTGAYTFAIRGTEGFFDVDMLADAQLLLGGAARAQIVSLYNYVQRLITPAGQSAIQVEDVAPDIDPITGYVNDPGGIRTTTSATGLGYLAGVSGVTVTGHSLGGHLAAAAGRLFPGLIASTDTYNAPGFSLSYADALLDQFPGDAGAFPSTTTTNLVANAGADIVAAVGTLPGTPARIFIEDQGIGIGNHGKELMTDSLALYNLFVTLDPTLNINPASSIPKLTGILKASSATDAKTLETTLADLDTLFRWDYRDSSTLHFDAPGPTDDREDFYTKLNALDTYLKGTPLYNTTTKSFSLTVQSLVGQGAASLAASASAPTDLATRYALYKLNPFTVGGAGRPELLRLVRKSAAAYRHRVGHDKNENPLKEAA